MKKVDFIVAGFGLAGASVAMRLRQHGRTVVVFNDDGHHNASRAAAGIFNPITGKMMTKTWMAEELFAELHKYYHEQEVLTSNRFLHLLPIYIPFRSVKEQNDWVVKSTSDGFRNFIADVYTASHLAGVQDELGGMMLAQCGFLDVNLYLDSVRKPLVADGLFIDSELDFRRIEHSDDGVKYGDWHASAVIFCTGCTGNDEHPFGWLPVRALYGETIDIETDHPFPAILNRGVYVVPAGTGAYRVGATYRHRGERGPTLAGQEELAEKLRNLISVPFRVTGQRWGARPTSPDRRPMLGVHPRHSRMWVFNGLGTKGVSLAPYFSKVLVKAILEAAQLPPEVNISRFYPLYSKSRD